MDITDSGMIRTILLSLVAAGGVGGSVWQGVTDPGSAACAEHVSAVSVQCNDALQQQRVSYTDQITEQRTLAVATLERQSIRDADACWRMIELQTETIHTLTPAGVAEALSNAD